MNNALRLPLLALTAVAALAGSARAQEAKGAIPPAPARAVIAPAPQSEIWSAERFEAYFFRWHRTAADARKRFEAQLALRIDEIDRTCRLTEAQKAKLQLVGGGDIKRLFDGYDRAKAKFNAVNNDAQRLQREIYHDVEPLQVAFRAGPITAESLFVKSLRGTLTAEQFARYEAVSHERKARHHRARVELAVHKMEEAMPLSDAQRRALIAILTDEIKPVLEMGSYDEGFVMDRVRRVPGEKVKPIFSDAQWKIMVRQLQ